MSFGKSSSYTTPQLTQEQKDAISAQTGFMTGTIIPTYQEAVKGATNLYNQNAGGVLNAAQNQAGTASQAQQALGETGESALRTGITGLQSLFSPDYQALAGQQLAGQNAALQAKTAADIQSQIAQQRMGVGSTLASLGQGGLGGAQAAAANQVGASMIPQELYNKYASVIFGTPATSYNANFQGTQGSTSGKTEFGIFNK
jgi:hypothetical protein